MVEYPYDINQPVFNLSHRIKLLPTDYASLPDKHLVQLSAFYVTLKTGLGNFPEIYQEIQAAGTKPFYAIYAELVHRILNRKSRNKAALLHALYQQFAYIPYHACGKYGDLEWTSKFIFDTIDNRIASGVYETAILDLILDACILLEEFEPAYQTYIENALAQWKTEMREDAWLSLPISEVVHRIRIMTNYNDSLIANVEDPVLQSEHLLEAFSSRILNEAGTSVLIAYREALRNTYYIDTVPTKYFSDLERKVETQAKGTFSCDLLQTILMVDRLERELVNRTCLMAQIPNGGTFNEEQIVVEDLFLEKHDNSRRF